MFYEYELIGLQNKIIKNKKIHSNTIEIWNLALFEISI